MIVSIRDYQAYLTEHYGGRADEQGMFMKLVEEMGETAEVLNKRAGRKTADGSDLLFELGQELADILHYTVAIAAINGSDLEKAVIEKDKRASVKYNHKTDLETYISNKPL